MVDFHVVKEGNNHDEIGLQVFKFYFILKKSRGLIVKDWLGILIY